MIEHAKEPPAAPAARAGAESRSPRVEGRVGQQPQRNALPRLRGAAGNSVAPATLDASWDRRLSTGSVAPEVTIDLHGCTLDQAHRRLEHGLQRALDRGVRLVLLVTGRAPRAGTSRLDTPLRGIIRASVHDWIEAAPFAARIAAIRPAHARHGGAGALYIVLRRVRN